MSRQSLAISVRGLSKAYRLNRRFERRQTFGEAVARRLRRPFRREREETFWALKDLSLDVKKGDVVGIVGPNGAGKSTFLKVLSRITEPTEGKVKLFGRIGSLLEVGTGFHPELSGRENIYLNGAILGMRRSEIARQFDAIVDFASVEQFLETPVKRYSSGMYVRLAFAVAAHLEPEILVVDEVLAVGDAQFQKKCLGKMGEVSRGGRTVLFVSHNMQAVRQLCTHGLLLNRGNPAQVGDVNTIVEAYLRSAACEQSQDWTRSTPPSLPLTICAVRSVLVGEQPFHTLKIDIDLRSLAPHKPAFVAVDITDASGATIMQALPTERPFITFADRQTCRVTIDLPPLVPGHYSAGVWVGAHYSETLDCVDGCIGFEIRCSPTPTRTVPHTPDHGYIVPHSRAELLNGESSASINDERLRDVSDGDAA